MDTFFDFPGYEAQSSPLQDGFPESLYQQWTCVEAMPYSIDNMIAPAETMLDPSPIFLQEPSTCPMLPLKTEPLPEPSVNSASGTRPRRPTPAKPKTMTTIGAAAAKTKKGQGKTRKRSRGDQERRIRDRERNRESASRCRQRRCQLEGELTSRERMLANYNQYLSSYYQSLTEEVHFIKELLLQHANCDCALIQEYIADEARKSVDKLRLLSFSSPQHSSSMSGIS